MDVHKRQAAAAAGTAGFKQASAEFCDLSEDVLAFIIRKLDMKDLAAVQLLNRRFCRMLTMPDSKIYGPPFTIDERKLKEISPEKLKRSDLVFLKTTASPRVGKKWCTTNAAF
jgi:hypothetical protein